MNIFFFFRANARKRKQGKLTSRWKIHISAARNSGRNNYNRSSSDQSNNRLNSNKKSSSKKKPCRKKSQ